MGRDRARADSGAARRLLRQTHLLPPPSPLSTIVPRSTTKGVDPDSIHRSGSRTVSFALKGGGGETPRGGAGAERERPLSSTARERCAPRTPLCSLASPSCSSSIVQHGSPPLQLRHQPRRRPRHRRRTGPRRRQRTRRPRQTPQQMPRPKERLPHHLPSHRHPPRRRRRCLPNSSW